MMFNGGYGATMGQQWNDSQGLVETVELELSWSNDTRTWTRILPGTPLIPRSRKHLLFYTADLSVML